MKICATFCYVFLLSPTLNGAENPPPQNARQQMRNMIKNILVYNQEFRDDLLNDEAYFRKQTAGQHLRTTIVSCVDSHVYTSNFDLRPLDDIFFVRNIGNQIEPYLGSIDYGVYHLNSSLLLFLGHSQCGTVRAVTQGLEGLETFIQNELKPVRVIHQTSHPTDAQMADNAAKNVYNLVEKAHRRYQEFIQREKLWVVGAVYDFTPQGQGQLKIIQINDKIDSTSLSLFLEDLELHGNYEDDPGRPHY